MKKNVRYDDDLDEYSAIALEDEQAEENAMKGFAVVNEDGMEINEQEAKRDADDISEFVHDNSCETIASEIPKDEITVMFDNAKVAGVPIGATLKLKLTGDSGELFYKTDKVGLLKTAFVAKLRQERLGQFVKCTLKTKTMPYFAFMQFYSDKVRSSQEIK